MLLPLIIIAVTVGVLVSLVVIDLKHWILPDKLNLAFGVLGIAFHFLTGFEILAPHQMVFGALLGSGMLYLIRMGGNAYYKQESLGLGDVKLLAAAGLWLGVEGTVLAIVLGAAAGIVHGLIYAALIARREKTSYSLKRLALPAGPGFCVGIVLSAFWLIGPYFNIFPNLPF